MGSKTCSMCGVEKELEDFHRWKGSSDGHICRCKACVKAKNRDYYDRNKEKVIRQATEWKKQNPEKAREWGRNQYRKNPEAHRAKSRLAYRNNPRRSKDWELRKKYDITLVDYEQMVLAQDGKCAVCQNATKLFVDHNHDTGQVRGLLCHKCNSALGMLRESIRSCLGMIDYINRYAGES